MRLSVYEASQKLGISESAVRQRAYRGTLQSEKEPDGRLYVYISPQAMIHNTPHNNTQRVVSDDSQTLRSDYIDALKSQIESLEADKVELQRDKETLEQDKVHLREESVRKDHIIMSLTQRIPAIEASPDDSPEPRESAVTASEQQSKGTAPQESAKGEIKRSWWQRLFGGKGALEYDTEENDQQ